MKGLLNKNNINKKNDGLVYLPMVFENPCF
jgi:hypothetical protein